MHDAMCMQIFNCLSNFGYYNTFQEHVKQIFNQTLSFFQNVFNKLLLKLIYICLSLKSKQK